MLYFFDTSVLIAGLIPRHKHHKSAYSWLSRAKSKEIAWAVSAHTIAECYSVLTRLPLSPRLTPSDAKILIEENIENSAKIIALTDKEYIKLMKETAHLGLPGGIIYDAIIIKAAEKVKANKILTFNLQHFHRLRPNNMDNIISPV